MFGLSFCVLSAFLLPETGGMKGVAFSGVFPNSPFLSCGHSSKILSGLL